MFCKGLYRALQYKGVLVCSHQSGIKSARVLTMPWMRCVSLTCWWLFNTTVHTDHGSNSRSLQPMILSLVMTVPAHMHLVAAAALQLTPVRTGSRCFSTQHLRSNQMLSTQVGQTRVCRTLKAAEWMHMVELWSSCAQIYQKNT